MTYDNSEVIHAEIERLHDEEDRQNHRISELEQTIKQINDLVLSVQRISISLETLTKEVQKQGARLEKIEQAPLDRISSAKQTAVNTLIGVVIGALGVGLVQLIAAYAQ